MTLVELLVVVVIITTLVATAIPILNPTTDNRRMREASRAVNGFIAAAQTRATQIGRPFGVALKRLSQDTGNVEDRAKCIELYYVEQPAPFAGFDDASFVRVALDFDRSGGREVLLPGQVVLQFVRRQAGVTGQVLGNSTLPPGWAADPLPVGLFKQGDVVEVGGKAFQLIDTGFPVQPLPNNKLDANGYYKDQVNGLIARAVDGVQPEVYPRHDNVGNELSSAVSNQSPYWSGPQTFLIRRQPAPTSLSPLQLPPGTAIDLQASGLMGVSAFYLPWSSNTEAFIDNDQPVVMMFAPEGPVSRIHISQQLGNRNNPSSSTIEQIPSGQIALLIGRGDTPPAVTVGPLGDQVDLKDWSTNSQDQLKKVRADHNWLNGDSRWVVVGSSTGAVGTVENALLDPTKWQTYDRDNSGDVPFAEQIWAATEFVRQSSRVGGR